MRSHDLGYRSAAPTLRTERHGRASDIVFELVGSGCMGWNDILWLTSQALARRPSFQVPAAIYSFPHVVQAGTSRPSLRENYNGLILALCPLLLWNQSVPGRSAKVVALGRLPQYSLSMALYPPGCSLRVPPQTGGQRYNRDRRSTCNRPLCPKVAQID